MGKQTVDVSNLATQGFTESMDMDLSCPIAERNKRMSIPPDGVLTASDGRKFHLTRWCPDVSVMQPLTIQVTLIEIPESGK